MKAREILISLFSIVIGIFIGFMAYRKRRDITKKLEEITQAIQNSSVYERAKDQFEELVNSLKKVMESSKELPRDKEDEILSIVEEKIRKLEEIIKS